MAESIGRAPSTTYREAFLEILGNRGKGSGAGPYRERGFVVFARDASTLQPLQAACFEQSYNRPLTARYRLTGGLAFGTLLSALAADLHQVLIGAERPGDLIGDLLPPGDREWLRVMDSEAVSDLYARADTNAISEGGEIDREWVQAFFDAFRDERTLGVGDRLVVFCELADGKGEEPDRDEWQRVLDVLSRLPERMGIVFSNPPPEVELPEGDPHFLDLSLGSVAVAGEVHYRYADAALSGDQAAEQDHLNVSPFADALARLVLLPETRPLTIGIHAPWGGGKSSFMNFVHSALIKNVTGEQLRNSHWDRYFKTATDRVADQSRRDAFAVGLQLMTLVVRASASQSRAAMAYYPLQELDSSIAELDEIGPAKPEPAKGHGSVEDSRKRLTAARERLWRSLEAIAARWVVAVHFDAWRYENAVQIWAGLAHDITARLERALPLRARLWSRVVYGVQRRPGEFWMNFVLPVVAAVVVGALVFASGKELGNDVAGGEYQWLNTFIPIGSVALTVLFVVRQTQRAVKSISGRVLEYVARPDYRGDMGYQHRVIDDLAFLRTRMERRRLRFRGWHPTRVRDTPRIVVFIDNLDRCSDDHVVEILQAINLTLGASDFYVFLGVDTEMVYNGVARHYGFTEGANAPGARDFAESYLRKIIQLSFHLPSTKPEGRLTFISRLFSLEARADFELGTEPGDGDAPVEHGATMGDVLAPANDGFPVARDLLTSPKVQVLKEVRDTRDELEAFQTLQVFVSDNPRELKRLVNVHRLVKILLQRPEAPPSDQEQRMLVYWLVFCAGWPHLVEPVLKRAREHPDDRDCVSEVVGAQAESTDPHLRRFAEVLTRHPLGGRALRPDSLLDRAARVSSIVRDPGSGSSS
jgi:hypothetical protein